MNFLVYFLYYTPVVSYISFYKLRSDLNRDGFVDTLNNSIKDKNNFWSNFWSKVYSRALLYFYYNTQNLPNNNKKFSNKESETLLGYISSNSISLSYGVVSFLLSKDFNYLAVLNDNELRNWFESIRIKHFKNTSTEHAWDKGAALYINGLLATALNNKYTEGINFLLEYMVSNNIEISPNFGSYPIDYYLDYISKNGHYDDINSIKNIIDLGKDKNLFEVGRVAIYVAQSRGSKFIKLEKIWLDLCKKSVEIRDDGWLSSSKYMVYSDFPEFLCVAIERDEYKCIVENFLKNDKISYSEKIKNISRTLEICKYDNNSYVRDKILNLAETCGFDVRYFYLTNDQVKKIIAYCDSDGISFSPNSDLLDKFIDAGKGLLVNFSLEKDIVEKPKKPRHGIKLLNNQDNSKNSNQKVVHKRTKSKNNNQF